MRLPHFDYHRPEALDELLKLKESVGSAAVVLAGGTDLVVNLRNRLLSPGIVVSLARINRLREISVREDAIIIGAATPLSRVAEHEEIARHFPMLRSAVDSIGAVSIQHFRGTIGGNVCSLPRCIFYNQSHFWRTGKGQCHRTGGRDCLALPGSSSCQAICSGDTVPVMAALSTQVTVAASGGSRILPFADLFSGKGESPFNITPQEIVTEFRIPLPWGPLSTSYKRISLRSAVDFPLVNAATAAIVEKGKVETIRVVLSACGPSPIALKEVEALIKGNEPSRDMLPIVERMARQAAEGVIIENAIVSKDYRIKMAGVVAKRSVAEALGF
jgi:4-hydroxybenzoyl-CoA reductase beta subunit